MIKIEDYEADQLDRIETKIEEQNVITEEMIHQMQALIEIIQLLKGFITQGGGTIPQPPPPPPPDQTLPFVTVINKTPLMEVSNYDRKGKAVLRMYKYGNLKLGRIRAKAGKKLYYVAKVKTAQGVAFALHSFQNVDGFSLTIGTRTIQEIPGTRNPKQFDKRFYILKTKVIV